MQNALLHPVPISQKTNVSKIQETIVLIFLMDLKKLTMGKIKKKKRIEAKKD